MKVQHSDTWAPNDDVEPLEDSCYRDKEKTLSSPSAASRVSRNHQELVEADDVGGLGKEATFAGTGGNRNTFFSRKSRKCISSLLGFPKGFALFCMISHPYEVKLQRLDVHRGLRRIGHMYVTVDNTGVSSLRAVYNIQRNCVLEVESKRTPSTESQKVVIPATWIVLAPDQQDVMYCFQVRNNVRDTL